MATRRVDIAVPPTHCASWGEETFEDRGAQGRLDQAFGDVRVRGVELVQVRVRLPLLEAEYNLPAEPIEPRDQVDRKRGAR